MKETGGTKALSATTIKLLQQKIGSSLFCVISVDMTCLVALSTLALSQYHGTEETARSMANLLNYCATYWYAVIQ